MTALINFFDNLYTFIDSGGYVQWVLFIVSICLWSLIAERYLYLHLNYPVEKARCLAQWNSRDDRHTKPALYIRNCLIAEVKINMRRTLSIIKMLIGLCPLLGLLGTVLGMIHVFDVIAVIGTSNAREMAAGISQATISTMSGMTIAIGGLYFSRKLEQRVNKEIHQLIDLLKYH